MPCAVRILNPPHVLLKKKGHTTNLETTELIFFTMFTGLLNFFLNKVSVHTFPGKIIPGVIDYSASSPGFRMFQNDSGNLLSLLYSVTETQGSGEQCHRSYSKIKGLHGYFLELLQHRLDAVQSYLA